MNSGGLFLRYIIIFIKVICKKNTLLIIDNALLENYWAEDQKDNASH